MARVVPLSIGPSDYEYPADTQARERLSQLRDLKEFSRDFISRVAEPWLSGELFGNGVRVTRTQLPWLYSAVSEVAGMLSVPVPHVFVRQDPYLNAFTHGVGNQSFLAITHSLLQQVEGGELRFIIAHELGHIKSQHVLYTTMASYLLDQARERGSQDFPPLLTALLEWEREAEVTADRAGLLVCGDVNTACAALLTLVVGSRELAGQIDVKEFVEDQELSLEFNPLARQREMIQSHPFMTRRIKELLQFSSSEAYTRLAAGGITLTDGAPGDIDISLGPAR